MSGILDCVKVTRVSNAVAAGTSDINTTGVSQVGFKNIAWNVHFGTITAGAVTSVKVQVSDDDGGSDAYADVEGSSQSVADDKDNKIVRVEILATLDKWYRLVVDRGTQNAVVDSVEALQSGATELPITNDSSCIGNLQLQSPDEGTA